MNASALPAAANRPATPAPPSPIRRLGPCCAWLALAFIGISASSPLAATEPASPYARWNLGPSTNADFFPIAVWLQSPDNATRYRNAGINTYVGLWKGPTETQLTALKAAGMRVICNQNAVGLQRRDDPTIIAWMHGDEPDNAQSRPGGDGYDPPVRPENIVADYERLRATDPSRPILLNLGQGVAWDGWYGRGVRTNHPEDYPQYLRGCDIASFDIYPAVHDKAAVAGHLEFVARGVERLVQWSQGQRVVWNCLECTRISSPTRKATPHQVRAEAWMSLIHGSMGLIYFVHEWQPKFNEHALLDDPEMLGAVTRLNLQIQRLAPVLNSPTLKDAVRVVSSDPAVTVATLAKRHDGKLYVFAVGMRNAPTTATFTAAPGHKGNLEVEVLDENRTLTGSDAAFADRFQPWDVHLYRLTL